ncbi:hypothetical protein EHW64_08305 [Erwinia psidii]|uniref:SpaN/EivJ family type III secretion system needle length determinant n=1 Tax=Erwinia psidii TaxID=69224 RepID=UPI00226B9A55|nr:type III secretion system needle length determinant, SpaN/EivJ family [Erwinia psidii]MCX8961157.1 hypothetical protein [Erwinia psidii]
MSVKITEVVNNVTCDDAVSEDDTLSELVRRKIKSKAAEQLTQIPHGMAIQLFSSAENYSLTSGGLSSEENKNALVNITEKKEETTFSWKDDKKFLLQEKNSRRLTMIASTAADAGQVNHLKATHAATGNDVSKPLLNSGLTTNTELQQQILQNAARQERLLSSFDAEKKTKKNQGSDANLQQNQTVSLNEESTTESQTASTAEHSRLSITAMLQNKMRTQATASFADNHSLNLDYKFQQWSGDHSVKVSLPVEKGREGNLTLLPSGSRAAEILSSQFSHLTSHTPKLLEPDRDGDQQRRQQQNTQDEEQE